MSSNPTYDVCVIGAGVVGSSTARYLASRGQRTLLLEQFPLPHWRGSSHGQTRIIRFSYVNPYYSKMVREAGEMWKEIEEKAEQEILIKTVGLLTVEGSSGENLREVRESLDAAGASYDILSNQTLKQRFPELSFPPHYKALLEHSAGILKADKCLRVLQDQFIAFGGTLRDGEGVVEIHPGSLITIKTTKDLFKAHKVILTAGPWTNKLLKPVGITLPLKPLRANVFYWKVKKTGTYSLQTGFPTFYDDTASDPRKFYALPSFEYPDMVKFGPSGGCRLPEVCMEIDPDARDWDREIEERIIQRTREYIQHHFPYLDHHEPTIVETCIYTLTPDENFVLDKHPKFSNIIIGAGFSAHGFKLGPVCGKILAQLAMNETPTHDLTPFKISRFKFSQQKSSL
ncbi:peroxisomal sarcosine oxidase isoform X1 [Pocillopora verrucosa]|uniref:peroxisomal sarcosine oxidase isoform X1 n=2 Tax=Pocillopora verrucosa TaxID=203993 RepID=UPI002797189C|nr:peroxisomal sarcosine oxidase-like isoform X1 [Pocillopora verrucosa]